ncbi:hypothetical protein EON83_11080 [bacterium]|nr:MAG: hypothetical protein EON83_11080 [bacterium]
MNNTTESAFLAVEPLPQQPLLQQPQQALSQPAFVPTFGALASDAPEVPEWERPIPPPAIAQVQPDASIDAAAYREEQRRAQFAPQPAAYPQAPAYPVAPPVAYQPAYQPPYPPQQQQPTAPLPPLQIQHGAAPPAAYGVQTPAYSPFRDDQNGYNLVVEHRGIHYFLREMSPEVQTHANTFERRFAAEPRNRVVDINPGGPTIDRTIALEEVVGGALEWFGQTITCEPGAIYNQMPALKGYLTVRALTVEEAGDEKFLLTTYPSTYKKLIAAKERMYEEVLSRCLVGWSIVGAEVNRANINRLAYEVKRTCFLRLGAGSVMGLNESDFLSR